jgi:hypothetical protein
MCGWIRKCDTRLLFGAGYDLAYRVAFPVAMGLPVKRENGEFSASRKNILRRFG